MSLPTDPRGIYEEVRSSSSEIYARGDWTPVARLSDSLLAADYEESFRPLIHERGQFETFASILSCWRNEKPAMIVRSGTPERAVSSLKHVSDQVVPVESESHVLITSGTTGGPKPVALSATSLLLCASEVASQLTLTADDVVLSQLPLGHAFGLAGIVVPALLASARLVMVDQSSSAPVSEAAIRQHRCTLVQGPPAFFRFLASYWSQDPALSVRAVLIAGGIVEPALEARIRQMFPKADVAMGYGMTEAGPRISHVPLEDPRVKLGFVGKQFRHWSVRDVATAEGSVLAIKGQGLMLGFLDAGDYHGIDTAGWYVSDDLATVENDGLYIHGRRRDVFKRGGSLVNPAYVERSALSLPGVIDARCLSEPHSLLGSVPILRTLLRDGWTEQMVLRELADLLESPMMPVRVEVVESLPPRKGPARSQPV